MSGRYASGTDVTSDRSQIEISRTIARYGASAFVSGWGPDSALIEFAKNGRRIRFVLPLPERGASEFTLTPTGRKRSRSAAEQAYDQAVRQKWRALALVIKAKFEAVESGIVEFESEFLAHTVLPSGRTVSDEVGPQVAAAYELGTVKPLQIEARS